MGEMRDRRRGARSDDKPVTSASRRAKRQQAGVMAVPSNAHEGPHARLRHTTNIANLNS